jgi:hypothetical protein
MIHFIRQRKLMKKAKRERIISKAQLVRDAIKFAKNVEDTDYQKIVDDIKDQYDLSAELIMDQTK